MSGEGGDILVSPFGVIESETLLQAIIAQASRHYLLLFRLTVLLIAAKIAQLKGFPTMMRALLRHGLITDKKDAARFANNIPFCGFRSMVYVTIQMSGNLLMMRSVNSPQHLVQSVSCY